MEDKLKIYRKKDYIFSIFQFGIFIDSIYSNENYFGKEKKGYIIDSKEYQDLKEKIKYNDYFNNQNKSLNNKINEIEDSEQIINIKKLKQIKFKSSEDLINNLIINKTCLILLKNKL